MARRRPDVLVARDARKLSRDVSTSGASDAPVRARVVVTDARSARAQISPKERVVGVDDEIEKLRHVRGIFRRRRSRTRPLGDDYRAHGAR